jgi:hypothetical protein
MLDTPADVTAVVDVVEKAGFASAGPGSPTSTRHGRLARRNVPPARSSMKLLFVVQRYGDGVVGGSGSLSKSGHARRPARPRGTDRDDVRHRSPPRENTRARRDTVDGLVVHRMPVDHPREMERFLDSPPLSSVNRMPPRSRAGVVGRSGSRCPASGLAQPSCPASTS